ncbi:MAG: aldo/keto reductase [Bacteroidaceae bacterium]|nr:aldo/keto reductase [Bacteroidaceae bacterium]
MNYRTFGKTNFKVSEISLGTWQLGSKWGDPFNEKVALDTLQAAIDNGINLFDTADIYQDGNSEKAIGKFLKMHPDKDIFVVTKMGRDLNPHVAEGYNEENLRRFVNRSRQQLGKESLDLTLLHCPPTSVFYDKKVFDVLDAMKAEGLIKHYGVSIEKVEEGLAALEHDISAIEVIFNMFRTKPAEELFKKAAAKNVGIIVRVPLASGLLTGKYTENTTFGPQDHRSFNRNGEAFDKGETFSGVDYATGIRVAQQLKEELHTDNLAATALRWILMHPEVSVIIPGASRPEQIKANVTASELPALSDAEMVKVQEIYDKEIRPSVHHLW